MRNFIEMDVAGHTLRSHHKYDRKVMINLIESSLHKDWTSVLINALYVCVDLFIIYTSIKLNLPTCEIFCAIVGTSTLYFLYKACKSLSSIYFKNKCLRSIRKDQSIFDSM